MPTYQRSLREKPSQKKNNVLEALVQAGPTLVDRTEPLPRLVENNLELCMSDLLHLWIAKADPEFYSRLIKQEL
jgi:hypothetical protein